MTRPHIFIILFILSVIAGIHGRGLVAIAGIAGIFLFEIGYVVCFLRGQIKKNINIATLLFVFSFFVYAVLFPFINSLELWVDEIEVIRFARLPLADIAQAVMTKHVTVPPLDYWNMWAWNKIVVYFPIDIWEYAYRIPYMALHSLAAVLLGLVCWGLVKSEFRLRTFVAMCGFFLYFFNPLLFAYSYEVRFYAMTFLGAAIVAALYTRNKLFAVEYIPIILLFCLNSVYQYIILVPFILHGVVDKTTRKNALLLGSSVALIALLVLPFLYVPQPVEAIYANDRIMYGLYWLNTFYFNTFWKQYLAYVFVLALFWLRKKKALFTLGACVFYVLVVTALDAKYNYRYFGGKHFLFIMPFCTLVIYELFSLSRSLLFRIAAVALISVVFLYPFYGYIQQTYTKEFVVAKSPMGLKDVFQYATKNSVKRVFIEYGDINQENIEYYRRAITWYGDLYTLPKVEEFVNSEGCVALASSPSSLLYSVSGVPPCDFPSNTEIIHLYGAAMMVKR